MFVRLNFSMISHLRHGAFGLNQNNVCSLSHRRLTRRINDIRQQEIPSADVTIAEIVTIPV
jgi:hypothetical protein